MKKYDIHVCIVSKQIDANLLPVLNKETRPQKVILLVSEEMKKEAENLEVAIKDYGISVEKVKVSDIYNIQQTEEILMECLAQYENTDIVVNITGGPKPVTIACFGVCQKLDFPYFYQNVSGNEIYISNETPNTSTFVLNEVSFQRYLKAHGYDFDEKKYKEISISKEEEGFYEYIFNGKYGNAVATLNYLASSAENSLCVSFEGKTDERVNALLDKPYEYGWLKNENKQIRFTSEEHRRFLNGIWLEKAIYKILKEIIATVKLCWSAEVTQGKNNNKNEFDLMFFYKNKLHLIEVKTCLFKENNENQNIVHKLWSLAEDVGGLSAKRCLVSYYPLYPKLLSRAKDKKIHVIHDHQVQNKRQLIDQLKLWINQN